MVKVGWDEIKSYQASVDINFQYVEGNDYYKLFLVNDSFKLECLLFKNSTESTDFETNYKSAANNKAYKKEEPFASKTIGQKKLFRRVHGVKKTLSGDTSITIDVPYAACKINAIEIMWAPEGLQADLNVYDTPQGHIQMSMGVPANMVTPSLLLNQFGFNTGVAKDFYEESSNYDADLIQNMRVEVLLKNPNLETKDVCVNFILHELKD